MEDIELDYINPLPHQSVFDGKINLIPHHCEGPGVSGEQCITEVARTMMKKTVFSRKTVGYMNPAFHPFKTGA